MVGADGMVEDEKQKEWQVRAVAKLEKLMISWVSPETGGWGVKTRKEMF